MSHNRIEGKFDSIPRACASLRRLDISGNQFKLTPAQLEGSIYSLAKLSNLVNLKVSQNPFCELFPEYQVYFLKGLSILTVLDDHEITAETRSELLNAKLYSMD